MDTPQDDQPRFTVDTHLFRELGELLVGRDSTALVELIKNAYDADAKTVTVNGQRLSDPQHAQIKITDDGVGMNEEQFRLGFPTSCLAFKGERFAAVTIISTQVYRGERDWPSGRAQAGSKYSYLFRPSTRGRSKWNQFR
jgi:hypothetical protein